MLTLIISCLVVDRLRAEMGHEEAEAEAEVVVAVAKEGIKLISSSYRRKSLRYLNNRMYMAMHRTSTLK